MATNMFNLDMFNARTTQVEINYVFKPDAGVHGLCVAQLDGKVCIAVSFIMTEWCIRFWAYPNLGRDPFYTYTTDQGEIGPTRFAHGKLFVVNWDRAVIQEFDTSTKPIKPTGHEIQTDQTGLYAMDMRVANGKEVGNLKFFMNYSTEKGELLQCFSYTGQLLWAMKPRPSLERRAFCTDKRGRLFEADSDNKKISLVKDGHSLQPHHKYRWKNSLHRLL